MSGSGPPKKDDLQPTRLPIYISTATPSSLEQAAELVEKLLQSLSRFPDRNEDLIRHLLSIQRTVADLIEHYDAIPPAGMKEKIEFLLTVTTSFIDELGAKSREALTMLDNVLPSRAPEYNAQGLLPPQRFPTSEEIQAVPPTGEPASVRNLFIGMQRHPEPTAVLPRRTEAIPVVGRNDCHNHSPQESSPASTNPTTSPAQMPLKRRDSEGMSQMSFEGRARDVCPERQTIGSWTHEQRSNRPDLLPNAPFSTPPHIAASGSPTAPLPGSLYEAFQSTSPADPVVQVAGPSRSANPPRAQFILDDDTSSGSFYVTEKSNEDYAESSAPACEADGNA